MNRADPQDDRQVSAPVLVVAPFRADAAVLGEMLRGNGVEPVACAGSELPERLDGSAAIVMSQEALTPATLDTVGRYLKDQPPWSEFPLILLLDRAQQSGAVLSRLRRRLPGCKLFVLQRPVRAVEFVTVVQSALAARARQLQLRDHIEWQEELQRELNHRVKNILANVVAIYHMTKRQSGSMEAFAESFEGRLSALSRVHSALVVADQSRPLSDVADLVLAPYRSASETRVVIDGPRIEVQPQIAVTLALCFHELATNAAKYGAFSSPAGVVSLTWGFENHEDASCVRLTWTERGGPPVTPPTRRGYGTAFVRSAMRSGTRVEFDYRPEGLVCTIVIPRAQLTGPDGP